MHMYIYIYVYVYIYIGLIDHVLGSLTGAAGKDRTICIDI